MTIILVVAGLIILGGGIYQGDAVSMIAGTICLVLSSLGNR